MASIVLLAGVCRHLSSVVVCNTAAGRAGGLGARAVGRPTLHGGPVALRPVRATPCFYKHITALVVLYCIVRYVSFQLHIFV